MTEPAPLLPAADARPPFYQRLGARLALMVAVAMLPLGVLGLVQSQAANDEAEQRANLAIMDETLRAATPQIRLILAAQVMAATLAKSTSLTEVFKETSRCRQLMQQVAADEPALSLVAFVPLSGRMTCTSVGKDFDVSESEGFLKVVDLQEPGFSVNGKGPVSGVSVLSVTHPVYDTAGKRVGFIAVSIPHHSLDEPGSSADSDASDPLALLTFDENGTVLTSSVGLDDAPLSLPSGTSLQELARGEARTFLANTVAGEPRIFSVLPMADGLFLLGSWARPGGFTVLGRDIGPYIVPSLMWIAAMVVALLGAETLVARHMRHVVGAMTAFAGGDRKRVQLDLQRSPAEIKALGRAYDVLTDTILHDEAELENMLRQKEILLREVHHRTGNSLQLIASIMRIHIRQEKSVTVREILEGLHDRVMALATVHMGLYETAGQKDVKMDTLFSGVIRQISGMGKQSNKKPHIATDFEPIQLIPDQAVPLALLLTELLAGMPASETHMSQIEVSLRLLEGEQKARLHIKGPASLGTAASDQPTPTAIGTQLVRGFAQQIGGAVSVANTAEAVNVTVDFPIREGFEP
ncbi:MAG: sensor histidine kinase [Cypionkella sp.]|uniref:sensor histidine kinase n=1 Tax=Cypionkella sp. TaxID=2811411 RepID=UPI002AB90C18|nr:sensor histidine kinase [Cypionkella sp.]MDZ4310446.1 sensor histidine kinase [Cypionkella sp.]MDZ4393487.1 sensor histidine kinase [Cypionkella sp.]